MIVEKRAVSKSFSNAAVSYDYWAKPQKKISKRLVELLPVSNDFNNILDLGCGTGNVIEQLLGRYSTAEILGLDIAPGMVEYCMKRWSNIDDIKFSTADISSFNAESKHDLIISSCAFQWIDDFSEAIKNLICSLKKDGCLAMAVPIEGSFSELQESYMYLFGRGMPGLKYKSKEYYTDLVKKHGFNLRVADVETVYGCFSGVDVLKYFKKIGATFQFNKEYSPLSVRDIHRLIKYYENKYALSNGLLPVTHKVLYFVA